MIDKMVMDQSSMSCAQAFSSPVFLQNVMNDIDAIFKNLWFLFLVFTLT